MKFGIRLTCNKINSAELAPLLLFESLASFPKLHSGQQINNIKRICKKILLAADGVECR